MRFLKIGLIFLTTVALIVTLLFLPGLIRKKDVIDPPHVSVPPGVNLHLESLEDISATLDSPDITLIQLSQIDHLLTDQYVGAKGFYYDHIQGLRLLLLCLNDDNHTDSALSNIISLYEPVFSKEQRVILQRYIKGGNEAKRKWESSSRMSSLSNFNEMLLKDEN